MNYSLRTIGEDGLAENIIIGHQCKYIGKQHQAFKEFKSSAEIGMDTEELAGVFLHPYGASGYTLAYNTNDYYLVMPNGQTYDSYRFATWASERKNIGKAENLIE